MNIKYTKRLPLNSPSISHFRRDGDILLQYGAVSSPEEEGEGKRSLKQKKKKKVKGEEGKGRKGDEKLPERLVNRV